MYLRILGFLLGLATATSAAAQTLRPEPGLWYNPKRSGHGVDFQFAGSTLIGIWYTYDSSGRPTWYIASAPYSGTTWSASLLSARWNGSAAALTQVGTIGLRVHEDDRAEFSWNLDGNTGSEPFERLRYAASVPASNLTGIYHHATQTGWGLSFEVQGSTAAAVLYFYDGSGFPRWALGTGPLAASGADKAGAPTIPMNAFFSFGANAPYGGAPAVEPAGTLGLVDGRLSIDVLLPGALGGWQRDVPATLLTDLNPSYLFAHIQGPAIIPAGASVPYSARFDTDLANLDGLQYEWTVLYGDRVVQSTSNTVTVQPMGAEGLVGIQLEVLHPSSGRSAFATLTASAQLADLFDVAVLPAHPGALVGRDNRFDAVVIGGRAPYTYLWEGDQLSSIDASSTSLRPPCNVTGSAGLELRVEDADGRVATTRHVFSYAPGRCAMTILGPDCLQQGLPNAFGVRVDGEEYSGDDYQWSFPTSLGLGCQRAYCTLIGTPSAPDQFFALSVSHPAYGTAERRIARICPDGPRLAIQANPASLAPNARYVDLVLTASGGVPPFSMDLWCVRGDEDEEPEGSAAVQTGRCDFDPLQVGVQQARATVFDGERRGFRTEVLIPIVASQPLAATLDSPSAPSTCIDHAISIAIANGTAPFDVLLDFGDGSSPYSTRTSNRSLQLVHAWAPASAGSPRTLSLRVSDSAGGSTELSRQPVPVNAAVDVEVRLRNAAAQNIHIYDRSTPAGGWFDPATRLTPGATRIETVRLPAEACEGQVEWGAGRNSTQLTERSCTYRKREPAAGLTFTESGGAMLSCD